jgi:hypothetical protein
MRMLGPPTPDTRTPSTVGATPALTFYPTTCTKTITPPPTPAHSLQHPRHKPAAAHHRRPSLTTACPASAFPLPNRPPTPTTFSSRQRAPRTPYRHPLGLARPPDQPPLPLPSLPLPLAAHSLPLPAPPPPSTPPASQGRADPQPPQAPQPSPLVRCPHRPFSPAAHR